MEQWEKNFYISSIAGANNGSSLVVMSKGLLNWHQWVNLHSLSEWLVHTNKNNFLIKTLCGILFGGFPFPK